MVLDPLRPHACLCKLSIPPGSSLDANRLCPACGRHCRLGFCCCCGSPPRAWLSCPHVPRQIQGTKEYAEALVFEQQRVRKLYGLELYADSR